MTQDRPGSTGMGPARVPGNGEANGEGILVGGKPMVESGIISLDQDAATKGL
jgi:hypothetical protein